MTIIWDDLVGAPLHAIFGEDVLYCPLAGDAPFTVNGIFDEAYHELTDSDDGGAPIATVQPIVGVRIAEFPFWPPQQGDQLVITAQNGHAGGVFVVKNFEADGKGAAKLRLNYLGE